MNAKDFNDTIRGLVDKALNGRQMSFVEIIGILDNAKGDVRDLLKAIEYRETQKQLAAKRIPANSVPKMPGLEKG